MISIFLKITRAHVPQTFFVQNMNSFKRKAAGKSFKAIGSLISQFL
jgi:hypothetical protein